MSRALRPEDVLRLKFIRDARISPAGNEIAYLLSTSSLRDRDDLFALQIRTVDTGTERRMAEGPAIRSPRWSGTGDRLAYVDQDKLIVCDVRMCSEKQYTFSGESIQGAPAWSPDGRAIVLILGREESGEPPSRRLATRHYRADGMGFFQGKSQRLCLVDSATGVATTLVDDLGFYSNIEWDDSGERVMFLGSRDPIPFAGYSPQLYSVRISDRHVTRHFGDGWYIEKAKWMPGAKRIAVIGAYQSKLTVPTTDLWVVDCDGTNADCRTDAVRGRVGCRVHHDMPLWELEALNGLVIRDSSSAWISVQLGGSVEVHDVSLSGPARCERVLGGDRVCVVLDSPADRRAFLYFATDAVTPADLFLFDGHTERRITELNSEVLSSWPQVTCRHVPFRSSEGMTMDAWFLSAARNPDPVPTVMFIHGGPYFASGHAFHFDAHMLASHDMGVLFANFRGSFGYGEDFTKAIVGDWGERGFPDHMAAVDVAIKAGLADPGRLGVWGASHGGFATSWIVGHTDRFRAAVAEAAVTNFTSAYYLSDCPEVWVRELGGKPHEIPDVYRSRSPLTYAHRCKTPTLMLHGDSDLRCPLSEAEQFFAALLDAGCKAELVRIRGASHLGDSMGSPAMRVAQNEALLDWFKRYL